MQWINFILCFIAGFCLGMFFFGGLWFTIRNISSMTRPSLLIIISFFVRTVVVMAGFYLILKQGMPSLLIALAGYLVSRTWCIGKIKPLKVSK